MIIFLFQQVPGSQQDQLPVHSSQDQLAGQWHAMQELSKEGKTVFWKLLLN